MIQVVVVWFIWLLYKVKIIFLYPWMVFSYLCGHSLLRPYSDKLTNEVPQLRTKKWRIFKICFSDPFKQFLSIDSILERRFSSIQLESKDTKAPKIESKIIIFFEGNLRTDIVRSSAISLSSFCFVADMNGPSKIS